MGDGPVPGLGWRNVPVSGIEAIGESRLEPRHDMGIAVQRDLDRRVAHQLGHLLGVGALFHQETRVAVSQVVKSQPVQASRERLTESWLEVQAVEGPIVERSAAGVDEQSGVAELAPTPTPSGPSVY